MKENIKEQQSEINMISVRMSAAAACTLLLLTAYVFSSPFLLQLSVYLFLLFCSRGILKDGFFALSAFSPNTKSLAAACAFAALLHGVSTFEERNCFFYAALTLSLFEAREYLSKRCFEREESYSTVSDKISAATLLLALAFAAVTIIINLFAGGDFFSVITRTFLVFVFMCPCAVGITDLLFAIVAAKFAGQHGIKFKNVAVSEKLGRVKELIVEQRGIITEKEYTLYDIYSVDNDKIGLLTAVAAVEAHFSHPFASAVILAARKICTEQKRAENCCEISGKGVCATVDGDKYLIGTKRLLKDKKTTLPEAITQTDFGMYMPLFVAKNGEFAGVLLLYSKMNIGAPEALNAIGDLGIRRIVLADGERQDIKNHAEILLFEREKVLQEFKKGAKIKAMTVTEKRVANADIVCVTAGDDGDISIDHPALQKVLYTLLVGRKEYAYIRAAVAASVTVSFVFTVLAAFDISFSPIVLALAVSFPLLFCIGISKTDLPMFTLSEEEDMFGKVNYTMKIDGMSCTHCSARVKTALESLRGVSANVSLEEKTARIKCPASTTAEMLAKAVSDVGFTVVSTERV